MKNVMEGKVEKIVIKYDGIERDLSVKKYIT